MKKAKNNGSAHVLLVKGVVAAANYYRDKVGFRYKQFWGDSARILHSRPRWIWADAEPCARFQRDQTTL